MSKHIVLLTLVLSALCSWSQPVLKRNGNSTLAIYNANHPQWNLKSQLNKWGRTDTLNLPFFDDFVSTALYPDSTRWFNNYVFVNNDFPVNPPSYGVATFDDLDSKGNPYQELNEFTFGPCDTLLSLAINLKDSSGTPYTIGDSLYFSFFFQRQGFGDPSDSRDSLVLQFKDTGGTFNSVWRAKGGGVSKFEFVMIGLKDKRYLYKGFQFRFINFARHTGNTNQWHVDYIHLAANRKLAVDFYDDIAIQTRPTSLLKNYFEMPYDHFQADSANQKAKLIFVQAYNLDKTLKNVLARHIESNSISGVIVATSFGSNNANIRAQDSAKRRFLGFNLNNLTSPPDKPIVIKREYELQVSVGDKYAVNDKITVYQEFGRRYAYDDGTAEYGFGYDDDVIDQFLKGAIAYKFNLTKPDSLWAIGMFFNRSIKSTSNVVFDLKVWQKISPVNKGRTADEPLLTLPNLTPKFTDSVNGYHVFVFDKAIQLPKGDFYIGWEQTGNYHLDVGYDINNGYHETQTSDNLYWVDRGNWLPVDFKGALMMRPYVGKRVPLNVKSSEVRKQSIRCYPNPFTTKITVDNSKRVTGLKVYDLSGKLAGEAFTNEIDMSQALPGIYTLQVTTESGEIFHQKMVKLQQ